MLYVRLALVQATGHSGTAVLGSQMVVIGGANRRQVHSCRHVLMYDTTERTWSKMPTRGNAPPGLIHHRYRKGRDCDVPSNLFHLDFVPPSFCPLFCLFFLLYSFFLLFLYFCVCVFFALFIFCSLSSTCVLLWQKKDGDDRAFEAVQFVRMSQFCCLSFLRLF